jgi:uncharacterized membrane protein YkvA (DUF1232 family)
MSADHSPGIRDRMRGWARQIKADVVALYLAVRHPQVPWHAKLVAALVAAYALSPVDLIPDFIPVLGYLDDIVLVPLGILLAVRLIPRPLMAELRASAQAIVERPVSRGGALFIVAIWLAAAGLLLWTFWPGPRG